MQQGRFEIQCEADINRLIKEFGEFRKHEIIVTYGRVKQKMTVEAKITEFLHILIEKEVRNLLSEKKILI
ncbi:hypothetical protein COU59_02190 [Candidatus Pacearchaeota archaeon CG10_big_fil_rev_8_21_14_0_10_34_12]|nr:MAG: hypothetical protein COU59_02190 [Candidatus Pacearchaeota archaeon CG10_big_fil_rev_8_21_14_0_10_34_12]